MGLLTLPHSGINGFLIWRQTIDLSQSFSNLPWPQYFHSGPFFLALAGAAILDCVRSHMIQDGGTWEREEEFTGVIPCEFATEHQLGNHWSIFISIVKAAWQQLSFRHSDETVMAPSPTWRHQGTNLRPLQNILASTEPQPVPSKTFH